MACAGCLLAGLKLAQRDMELVQPGLVHARVAVVGAVPIAIPQVAAGGVVVVVQEPQRDALVPDGHDGDAETLHDGRGGLIAVVALQHAQQVRPQRGQRPRGGVQLDGRLIPADGLAGEVWRLPAALEVPHLQRSPDASGLRQSHIVAGTSIQGLQEQSGYSTAHCNLSRHLPVINMGLL